MGNGLSNIHLDPGKVNKFLLSSPLKLVSGNLSEIKLSIEIRGQKLAVTVGTLNLVMYADTSSQYEYFKQDRDTMQDADSMMDDPTDTAAGQDGTPTLIDKIVSSFEVELLWKGANIEIQLGKEADENSRFFLSVGNIGAKKLKKTSDLVIHQLVASIGSLTMDFMRAGEKRREKMLSLHMVEREGKAVITRNAIEVGIDIMKEVSSSSSSLSSVSRFTVVRANAGALQGVLTLQCVLELVRLLQKVGSYMQRNMLMQRELLKFVRSWNRDHTSKQGTEPEYQETEFADEMFKSCVANPLLASFAKAGGLQDGLMSSVRFQGNLPSGNTGDLPATLTESFISRKQQAGEVAKQALNKEFEDTVTKGSLEIEANIQGIYIAFLKIPTFDTSDIFSWPTKLERDKDYSLEGVLANHFLLFSDCIQFQFQTKSKEGKRVLVSTLGIKDFMKKQDPQALGKANQSFLNRVDIQGLDESRLTHGSSSLYSSKNDSSKNGAEDEEFEFQSAIDPTSVAQYKEVEVLKFEKLVQIKKDDPSAVIWVTFNLDKAVPEVSIKINTVKLNIELDSFTLMSNRQEFANLLRKTTEMAAHQTPPSMESYGYILETDVSEILSDLKYLLSQVGEAFWRKELLKLFQIQDPNTITKDNSMKLTVDINKIVVRTGGVLDALKGKSVWADLELGAISILLQKQIIVTWRHPIDLFLQHTEKRAKVLSIPVSKEQKSENLVAIDDECLVTKLTGLDIFLSPEIFEGMLLLIDLSNHKLKKLDYSQEKFKLADAIAEVQKAQSQNEVKYQQELLINEICNQVMLKLIEVPPLVNNCYVFIGCISLYLHDEDITQEILTSLRMNRGKKRTEVWETIEMDGSSSIIETDNMPQLEDKTEARLREMNVVIQLDIRPVMIKANTKGDMAMMIHTILLRDGMTALSMQELKDYYKTHFCELYSINYKQARYDAKLANEKFHLGQALSNFKKVMNEYSGKGPFMALNIQEDPHNGGRKEIDIKMSSLVFRLGLGTARETFLCLIKIVDKTISKLNSITEVLKTMQQTHETEDMRDFRKKKAESVLSSTNPKVPEPKKPPEHEDRIKIQLETISVDLFNESYYRLVLNIANTSIHMGSAALEFSKTFSGKRRSNDPLPQLAVDVGNVRLLYRDEPEFTRSRSVEAGDLAKYYPLLLLPQAQVVLSAREEHGVPINFTNIYINPNSTLKGPLMRLDTYSISVLLQIVENLDRLVSDAKQRTKHIFVERVEVSEKDAEPEPSMDEDDEFITVGERSSENVQVDRLLTEMREEAARNKGAETTEMDGPKKETSGAEDIAKVQQINQTFRDHRKVIEACHVDGFRRGRQISVTSINIDKFVVELVQKYEADITSSLSLQLKKAVCVLQTESSFEDEKKKGLQRNRDTTSLVLSIQSLSIRDNTTGGMFKYLLKVQKHSLSCFFRSRVTSEKNSKQRTDAQMMLEELDIQSPEGEPAVYSATHTLESRPSLILESTDKIALVLKLNNLYVSVDDKSLNSLWSFSDDLKKVLDQSTSNQPQALPSREQKVTKPSRDPPRILMDYIGVDAFDIHIISMTATNLSLLTLVPNLSLKISAKSMVCHSPITWAELTDMLQAQFKDDYSPANLLKANKLNIPVVASFVSLVGGFATIYNSITRQDGRGVVTGFYDILMVGFVGCVNIGLFGLKSIGDLVSLLGKITNLAPGNKTLGSMFGVDKLQKYLDKFSVPKNDKRFSDAFR